MGFPKKILLNHSRNTFLVFSDMDFEKQKLILQFCKFVILKKNFKVINYCPNMDCILKNI